MSRKPQPLRQFIYATDLAKLMMWVMEEYEEKSPIILSVGEKDEMSISQVATLIAREFNYEHMMEFDAFYSDGQFKKTANNDKLMKLCRNFKFTTNGDWNEKIS
jgi:GDP-L-fucose synthase